MNLQPTAPPPELPQALYEYLRLSPLPVLVLHAFSPLDSPPLYINYAWKLLSGGQELLFCVDLAGERAIRRWLTPSGTSEASQLGGFQTLESRDAEPELEVRFKAPNAGVTTVRWRRTWEAGFVVLTALVLPSARPGPVQLTLELRLRELELLTEFSAVALARLDLDGSVLWVNNSWHRITGHPVGRPLDEWPDNIDPNDIDRLSAAWANCLATRTPLEIRFRLKTGATVIAHSTPNHVVSELVTGWISNLTDVTSQVRAEEAMALLAVEREETVRRELSIADAEARRIEAEEQRRRQDLLVDVASHEIRNPISAILQNGELTRSSLVALRQTLAELHLRNSLPEGLSQATIDQLDVDIEAVQVIEDCAMAQERIANDILGFGQTQFKRQAIHSVVFSLSATLRRTIRMFEFEALSKGVQLEAVLGTSLARLGHTMSILADPVRLSQIIINLVSNAIRFTAEGPQVPKKITLTFNVASSPPSPSVPLVMPLEDTFPEDPAHSLYLFFQVNDTGPGMTHEETQRVFEQFMQATPLTHVQMDGSGLGLWVARNLCELHGGQIEVISTLGVGSTFRGFIRAEQAPQTHLASPTSTPSPTVPIPGFLRLRILVVDDNAINRTILLRQLGVAGHDVDTAINGQEALDKILGGVERYDVVLMDVEMPVLDGIATTKAVRAAEESSGKRLRIIGCTGNARDGQVKAALDSGMDFLVTKPYRLAHLLERLADD